LLELDGVGCGGSVGVSEGIGLYAGGIRVSMFIEATSEQIDACEELGADAVELHTGRFANVMPDFRMDEVARLEATAHYASEKSLIVNAVHGLNYTNVRLMLGIPYWKEFNIGHSMCPEAFSSAWNPAVGEMLQLIAQP
jgi:pyridoxine 5-phosphate synthase